MIIGDRLCNIRKERKLSQGDIESKTGLLRCYISRVENGHTVPSLETLEKFARALEIPLYRLFYDGKETPDSMRLQHHKTEDVTAWGHSGKDAHILHRLRLLLARMGKRDRELILFTAQKMARRRAPRTSSGKRGSL